MPNHGLVRTSPKGGKFIGMCMYCGKENLTIESINEQCHKAPPKERQILDAIKGK